MLISTAGSAIDLHTAEILSRPQYFVLDFWSQSLNGLSLEVLSRKEVVFEASTREGNISSLATALACCHVPATHSNILSPSPCSSVNIQILS